MGSSILDLDPDELGELMSAWGEPSYRVRQLVRWLHRHGVRDFEKITVFPRQLRQRLASSYEIRRLKVQGEVRCRDGTVKMLLKLADGECIETVWMTHPWGRSLCMSVQVGCAMGCVFCASCLGGKKRDLTLGELIEQMLLSPTGQGRSGPDRVDLMGIGEPLDNLPVILRFLRVVTLREGFSLSPRRICLSTCGLVDGIRALVEEGWPLTLCISLHAPEQRLRQQLMPRAAARHSVEEVVAAGRYWWERTGRRPSFEYVLLAGINDQTEHARKLARLLQGWPCHVNLIRYNPVPGRPFVPSDNSVTRRFMEILRQAGVAVTLRRSLGLEMQAACGQLRRRLGVSGEGGD